MSLQRIFFSCPPGVQYSPHPKDVTSTKKNLLGELPNRTWPMCQTIALGNISIGDFELLLLQTYAQANICCQCHIQSYFETSIPVWDPKLKPPNAQKC